jgi:hypothetical protein
MRGGLSMTEAWQLTNKDRTAINNLIKNNMETSKKIKQAIF